MVRSSHTMPERQGVEPLSEPKSVSVTVPAETGFLQLLRLNVAGVMGDHGFTIDEIEDAKIAVEELAGLLLGGDGGHDLHVRIAVDDAGVAVEGRRESSSGRTADIPDFTATILGAVVDEHRLSTSGDVLTFEFRKWLRAR